MKFGTGITLALFLFLTAFAYKVGAGESKVNVSVSNQSRTDVYINQTGQGTSSVKVNGKEWKLEGPGEIKVNESTSSQATPSPQNSASPSATTIPSVGTQASDGQNLWQIIEDKIMDLKETIKEFFEGIF